MIQIAMSGLSKVAGASLPAGASAMSARGFSLALALPGKGAASPDSAATNPGGKPAIIADKRQDIAGSGIVLPEAVSTQADAPTDPLDDGTRHHIHSDDAQNIAFGWLPVPAAAADGPKGAPANAVTRLKATTAIGVAPIAARLHAHTEDAVEPAPEASSDSSRDARPVSDQSTQSPKSEAAAKPAASSHPDTSDVESDPVPKSTSAKQGRGAVQTLDVAAHRIHHEPMSVNGDEPAHAARNSKGKPSAKPLRPDPHGQTPERASRSVPAPALTPVSDATSPSKSSHAPLATGQSVSRADVVRAARHADAIAPEDSVRQPSAATGPTVDPAGAAKIVAKSAEETAPPPVREPRSDGSGTRQPAAATDARSVSAKADMPAVLAGAVHSTDHQARLAPSANPHSVAPDPRHAAPSHRVADDRQNAAVPPLALRSVSAPPSVVASASPALPYAFAEAMRASADQRQTVRIAAPGSGGDDAKLSAVLGAHHSAATDPASAVTAAANSGQQPPLDLRQDQGLQHMIDRIEALKTENGGQDAKIRLAPDALGTVDIAVRRDGDKLHVHFTAHEAAARTVIADAAPRLTELADARGVKLGQTTVDAGTSGHSQQSNHEAPQQQPGRHNRLARPDGASPEPNDNRIA
ncbi:flagellar hook-length control protein FliK [Stakelama marina]|uniref:Flagellar hook-length control protein FliK n=1 Tax=Stakelama marina TaxID=2826939 RepID=A0A8T4IJ51_9SPHN|nr:flagellar hook-length control protein FliK [Stakelama marina]MBR0553135.1 flagellar hook-length control protein FliK [Stakelama marina]